MRLHENNLKPGPFVLASILTSYPDSEFRTSINQLLEDTSIDLNSDLKSVLLDWVINEDSVNDLRSEYISVFDQAKSLNPLYETEYGRERAMFKATELADIAGFYRAFGFEMNQDGERDMVDHVSVELEFYSLLMMKFDYLLQIGDQNGCEVIEDGMKKFMNDHLGRFVGAIAQRDGVRFSDSYRSIFQWVDKVVKKECQRLGVKPEMANWLSSQAEPEEVSCGGSIALNG